SAACGGIKYTGTASNAEMGDQGLSHVQLTVHNLSKPDADAFIEQLSNLGRIQNGKLTKWEANTAVFDLDVKGCECELPQLVANVPMMGFKYEGRLTSVRFSAFDNKPPTITFVSPDEGKVITEQSMFVSVEIPQQHVA